MEEPTESPVERPHYRWPKIVLGLLILGITVAVLSVWVKARRLHEERQPLWPSQPAATN